MNEEPLEQIERRLARLQPPPAPAELRMRTLNSVHRQLAGQRWESRLGRVAVALLLVGVGLNVIVDWQAHARPQI